MKTFSFSTARKIIFGSGSVVQLGGELTSYGSKKIAIITEEGMLRLFENAYEGKLDYEK